MQHFPLPDYRNRTATYKEPPHRATLFSLYLTSHFINIRLTDSADKLFPKQSFPIFFHLISIYKPGGSFSNINSLKLNDSPSAVKVPSPLAWIIRLSVQSGFSTTLVTSRIINPYLSM